MRDNNEKGTTVRDKNSRFWWILYRRLCHSKAIITPLPFFCMFDFKIHAKRQKCKKKQKMLVQFQESCKKDNNAKKKQKSMINLKIHAKTDKNEFWNFYKKKTKMKKKTKHIFVLEFCCFDTFCAVSCIVRFTICKPQNSCRKKKQKDKNGSYFCWSSILGG